MRKLLVAFILLLILGCDTDRPDSDFFSPVDVGTLVVDATLIVGRSMPTVLLSRTIAPGSYFDPVSAAEALAAITITDRDSQVVINYNATAAAGLYVPAAPGVVRPGTPYELRVVTAEGEVLTASTVTPQPLDIGEWLLLDEQGQSVRDTLWTFDEVGDGVYTLNQLVYLDGLLEGRLDVPAGVGYHIGIESLDRDSEILIDPAFFDEEDFANLDRETSSPAFEALDGTFRLPWFVIFFEGRYLIEVYATDRNWFDFVRSAPEGNAGGFGGTAGDAFARPIFHIEGGIGLFGSASADSIGFTVNPRP